MGKCLYLVCPEVVPLRRRLGYSALDVLDLVPQGLVGEANLEFMLKK